MKNVVCSWKTTIIGLLIVTASMASVFYTKTISWSDASIPLLIGIVLILSPDLLLTKIDAFIGSKKENNSQNIENNSENEIS